LRPVHPCCLRGFRHAQSFGHHQQFGAHSLLIQRVVDAEAVLSPVPVKLPNFRNVVDPAIWSFWHCVLSKTAALLKMVETTPITVEEWRRQRAIYQATDLSDPLSLGFSAFFLNRTNRSGVIGSGGLIGGLDQTGNYLMDCRFNREDLAHRIERVARYADRIHLTNLDGLDFLDRCEAELPANSLLFIDPPYFKKGPELYTNSYKPDDHAKLAAKVISMDRPWVVTYSASVMAPQPRRAYVTTLGREDAKPMGDDTPQVDKFRELARELECDEDEDAFDERLKKVATAPPKEPAPKD
jgi:site-specific DNA-adenine methylase